MYPLLGLVIVNPILHHLTSVHCNSIPNHGNETPQTRIRTLIEEYSYPCLEEQPYDFEREVAMRKRPRHKRDWALESDRDESQHYGKELD